MNELTLAEYQAVLRHDFYSFLHRCFVELSPETQYLLNWHIELMAAKLAACYEGKIRRLIITLPPRHLKSLCASIALPAWWLGHNPSAQIVCVSYGQDLAENLARSCRAIMESRWYQRLFPTRLAADKQSVHEFATTKQGYRIATSVGGVLTGRGADLIIVDDPIKADQALSDSQRKSVNDWFDNSLFTRLNNKETGCIIVVMQRLHDDDLVGHVFRKQGWEVVSFPAIAEQIEEHLIETPFGSYRKIRQVGDVLHPERESRDALERIRATIGEYNFAGQYQQSPVPLGGGLIKAAWFKTYEPSELSRSFDQIVQSWDTANKPGELNSFSVCTTWGIRGNLIYLLEVLRKHLDYSNLKREVRARQREHRATVVLIEDRASGTQLIQELRSEGLTQVAAFSPEGDKIMRLHAQAALIEGGSVYLPRQAPWLAEYLHELTTFPNSKHSDQADSTSQMLAWFKQGRAEPGIIGYYKLLCGDQKTASTVISAGAVMVVVRPPSNQITSTLYTMDGGRISARADGTFLVSEEDAKPLFAAGWLRVQ